MDRLAKALTSGSEHMSMPQYLEAQRAYVGELKLDLAHLVALGAPEYLRERLRLELASLGVRS